MGAGIERPSKQREFRGVWTVGSTENVSGSKDGCNKCSVVVLEMRLGIRFRGEERVVFSQFPRFPVLLS